MQVAYPYYMGKAQMLKRPLRVNLMSIGLPKKDVNPKQNITSNGNLTF